jgi:hypothetical protein
MNFIQLFVFALLCCNFQNASATPCPFSKPDLTCDCTSKDPTSNIFENAKCQVGRQDTMPKFNDSTNKYTITGELFIQFVYPIRYIEAKSFVAFKSIGLLTLDSKITSSITWNETAFQDTHVTRFSMTNIYHFNSAFQALLMVEKDLVSFQIEDAGACHFGANDLKDFDKLKSIDVHNTDVSTVDDLAFVGLEDTLTEIYFTDTGISKYPLNALKLVKKLKVLDLSYNAMTLNTEGAFAFLPELETLRLIDTNLQVALDAGAFKNLSKKLKTLDMKHGQLKKIPTSVLNDLPELDHVSFAQNQITTLQITDFPKKNKITFLCTRSNPITNIGSGAFTFMPSVKEFVLMDTKLKDFDITSVDDMKELLILKLDNNTALENMLQYSMIRVPQKIQEIHVPNSALKFVDSRYYIFLDKPDFKLFDISNNTNLNCVPKGVQWMAEYALCGTKKLKIDNARCGNLQGKLLTDYLNEIVSSPCK